MNNAAAREANGEILLLLNNDIDVIEPGWLRELVSQALRPDVGIVGAKLLFPNEQVQHAGLVLGPEGHYENDKSLTSVRRCAGFSTLWSRGRGSGRIQDLWVYWDICVTRVTGLPMVSK